MTYQTPTYQPTPVRVPRPVYGSRNLRRDLNVVFAALTIHLCTYLFSWIINDALFMVLHALFPWDGAYYAVTYAAEGITYAIEFLIPVVIIIIFAHISPSKLTSLPEGGMTASPRPRVGIFFALFAGLCAVETAGIISGRILDMFEAAGFDFYVGINEEFPGDVGGIAAYIFSISIVPGIVEELLFRGCVLGVFKRYNSAFAVLMSSLLFALMHCTVQQFFYAFCAGLVFGWLAVHTGRLWPGMIIHMLNNLVSVFLDYMNVMLDYESYVLVYIAVSSVIMALGTFGIVMLIRRGGRLRESVNEVSFDAAARAVIRPLPIIYLIIVVAVTSMVLLL